MAVYTVFYHSTLTEDTSWFHVQVIPDTYDHLLVKASTRDSSGGAGRYPRLYLGTPTFATGIYHDMTLYARTASSGTNGIQTGGNTGADYFHLYYGADDNNTADTFGNTTIWIPHYANDANFKQVFCSETGPGATVADYNWGLGICAGVWEETDAVVDVKFAPSAGNWMTGSSLTLYGVTGA